MAEIKVGVLVSEHSLDEMIMDVEVTRLDDGNVRIKFVAIAGGCGPELRLPNSLAGELLSKLQEVFEA